MMESFFLRRSTLVSCVALGLYLPSLMIAAGANVYLQQNLVSSVAGQAAVTDPNLLDPWGISLSSISGCRSEAF